MWQVKAFGLAIGFIALGVYFFGFFWPILAFVLACAAVGGVLYVVFKGVRSQADQRFP